MSANNTEVVNASNSGGRSVIALTALCVSVFALGTSEFVVAGVLSDIASSLRISTATAGALSSTFAIGLVVAAPITALVTLRLPTKKTVMWCAVLFGLIHVATGLATSFPLILSLRVIAAVLLALQMTIAAVMAVEIGGRDNPVRGMSSIVLSATLANALGVPLASLVSSWSGWRGAMYVVAALSFVGVAAVAAFVPDVQRAASQESLRELCKRELAGLCNRVSLVALVTCVLYEAGVFNLYTYAEPVFRQGAGMRSALLPLALFAFGLGSVAGVVIGMRVIQLPPVVTVRYALTGLALSLALFAVCLQWQWCAFILFFMIGMAAFSAVAGLNGRVIGSAPDSPTLSVAASLSALNLGNIIGPTIGGILISNQPARLVPTVSTVLIVLALATTFFFTRSNKEA